MDAITRHADDPNFLCETRVNEYVFGRHVEEAFRSALRNATHSEYELQVAAEQRRAAEASRDAAAIQSQPAAAQPAQGSSPVVIPTGRGRPRARREPRGRRERSKQLPDSQSSQNLRC